jgi:hypothetical protein
MATARVFRKDPDYNQNQTITIDSSLVPSPQGCIVSAPAGQQIAVTFNNTGPNPISITFTPQGYFSNIPSLTGSQVQNVNGGVNAGVNYYINGNLNEPYAIQLGDGPMIVTISTAANGSVSYSPSIVAVPLGSVIQTGSLEMVAAVPGNGYDIENWSPSDPFDPPITETGEGSDVATGATAGTYTYGADDWVDHKPPIVGGGGGGTVKIRSN